MSQIGAFKKTRTGYSGRIHTLTLEAELVLVPVDNTGAENAPDFRIHIGDKDGSEIGAAWQETGDKAGDYLSFKLDDPTLAQPIRANLFQAGDDKTAWVLHWNRPSKRGEKD